MPQQQAVKKNVTDGGGAWGYECDGCEDAVHDLSFRCPEHIRAQREAERKSGVVN